MTTTVSFPGLGIGPFTMNRTAFTIPIFGGRGIAWYGILITIGIILAFLFILNRAKKEGLKSDDVFDLAIFTVPFAIIGSRLYYVIFYGGYTSFLDIIAIWNGGLAIYGAVIAGGLTIFVISKVKKIPFLKLLDLVAPGVMIGQIIGRWGNFVNGEAHGTETEIFCRMGLTNAAGVTKYYHPTFLYESLWNLIGFLLILLLFRKKKYKGQIFFFYIAWYGFGRMFIEGLRTDSLYWGQIRISQLVGFACFLIGTALFIVYTVIGRKERLKAKAYAELHPEETENDAAPAEEAENDADPTEETDAETVNHRGENSGENAAEPKSDAIQAEADHGNED